jgi:hypothetical protein
MLPDTPYDPVISTITKTLREVEADLEALDFLTSGDSKLRNFNKEDDELARYIP